MKKPKPIRTDPELWEACKDEALKKLGKFSARAMQHAVILYKARGGGYLGEKAPDNALSVWQKHEGKKDQEKRRDIFG